MKISLNKKSHLHSHEEVTVVVLKCSRPTRAYSHEKTMASTCLLRPLTSHVKCNFSEIAGCTSNSQPVTTGHNLLIFQYRNDPHTRVFLALNRGTASNSSNSDSFAINQPQTATTGDRSNLRRGREGKWWLG